MALPDRETVVSWIGSRVVDPDGAELGTVARLYADDATGVPEWLTVDDDPRGPGLFLPLLDATSDGGQVRVAVRRSQVESAPRLGAVDAGLRSEEEVQLYEHYGISYSRSQSESVLPDADASVGTSDPLETADAAPAATSALPPPTRLRRIDFESVAPPVHSELDRAPEPVPASVTELPAPVEYPTRVQTPASTPAWKKPVPMGLAAAGLAALSIGALLLSRRRREPSYRRTARSLGSSAGSAAGLSLGLSDRAAAKLGVAMNRVGNTTQSAGAATTRVGRRRRSRRSPLAATLAKAALAKAVASRTASSTATSAKSVSRDKGNDVADKTGAAVTGLRRTLLRVGSTAAKAASKAGTAGGVSARVGSAASDTGRSAGSSARKLAGKASPTKRSRFGRKRSVSLPSVRGITGTINKVGSGTLSATAGKLRPSKRRRLSRAAGGAASTVSAAPKAVANSTSEITGSVVHTWRKTMARLSLLVGFAAGYVLGARAGTERYEQIKTTAQGLTQRPEVQQLKTRATDAVQSGSAGNSLKGLAGKMKSKSSSSTTSTYDTPAYDSAPTTSTYASETSFVDDAPVLTPDPTLDDTSTVDPLGTGTTGTTGGLGYGETGTGTTESYRDRL